MTLNFWPSSLPPEFWEYSPVRPLFSGMLCKILYKLSCIHSLLSSFLEYSYPIAFINSFLFYFGSRKMCFYVSGRSYSFWIIDKGVRKEKHLCFFGCGLSQVNFQVMGRENRFYFDQMLAAKITKDQSSLFYLDVNYLCEMWVSWMLRLFDIESGSIILAVQILYNSSSVSFFFVFFWASPLKK